MKQVAMALLALAAWPAAGAAQTKPDPAGAGAAGPESAAAVQERGVEDPRAFVEQRYQAYLANTVGVEWPEFAYSDRLRALFGDYDAWQRRHDDLVGSLDFDWWINAQDWELSAVRVTETAQGPDRRTEIARFTNVDRAEEIRFLFVRQSERWYLDDAVQGSGHGEDGWTLSELLQQREE